MWPVHSIIKLFFFNVLEPLDLELSLQVCRQALATMVKTAGHLPFTGLRIRLLEKSGGNILLKKQPGSLTISDYPQTTSVRLKTFQFSVSELEAGIWPPLQFFLSQRDSTTRGSKLIPNICKSITSVLGEESNRAPRKWLV